MDGGALSGLIDSIDALLAVDVSAMGSEELHAHVVRLERQRSRLAIVVGDALTVWEERRSWEADGSLTAARALARDTHSADRARREQLRIARALRQMPVTRQAVLDGRLSMDHAELFVRAAARHRRELFLRDERMLVDLCGGHLVFADSQRVVEYWIQAADDEAGARRQPPEPSTLYLSRSEYSGEGNLQGHLSPVDMEIVSAELRRLEREIHLEDNRNGVRRTLAQRRGAALARMAGRSVNATGVTARPLFQIIVGDDTARRLCETASGVVLHPDDLVPYLDSAVVESFLFDGPTTVIAKTAKRTFTGALRAAIKVRDRRCRHRSGCDTPAVHADVDHRRPTSRGGPTSQYNGRVECIPHNRLAHLHDEDDPGDAQLDRPDFTSMDALRARIRWEYLRDAEEHPEQFEASLGWFYDAP